MNLVMDRTDPAVFDQLAERFSPLIKSLVAPFARDRMLSRIDDFDSLLNLCLLKLDQARSNFKYESELGAEHNERRFIALVRKSIRHILIDHQYSANLGVRSPEGGLRSLEYESSSDAGSEDYCPSGDSKRQISDGTCTPLQNVIGSDLLMKIESGLEDEECMILGMLRQGFSAEGIARRTGTKISRVRYLIYSRIQPEALHWMK